MFSRSNPLIILLAVMLVIGLAAFPRALAARVGGGPVMRIETGDSAIIAAFAEARRTLPDFLAVLAHPDGASDFRFNYRIGGLEHVWVVKVERRGDSLAGRLANKPRRSSRALGDLVVVPLSEVRDWSYRDTSGVVHGQYTNRVVLKRLDPAQAAEMRRDNGWED